jgi:hypothetical protein
MARMDPALALALALDPSLILRAQGLDPDPWQRDFLRCADRQVLLNCCRQSGKSTATAARALHEALFLPRSLILLLSPTQRQSGELFRKVRDAYGALGRPIPAVSDAPSEARLELANGSRVIGLPGDEATIRGFSRPALLLIDEAAKVPDALYRAVRPMLAVSRGRLVCLSTPFGQRGFFFREWHSENRWRRFRVTWRDCPRIAPAFVEAEAASTGQNWVDQEYNCLFTALEGLVYPDFEASLTDDPPAAPAGARYVGGIDWGFNNPFAAVWGHLDRDDVLWVGWERYQRQCALREHIAAIRARHQDDPACPDPTRVTWYADPSGPGEIVECRAAGWKVLKGFNEVRLGIAAVTARLRSGRLRVVRRRCPNLVAESRLYRYPAGDERALIGERPVDEHNHALGALRYLVARLDHTFIARLRKGAPAGTEAGGCDERLRRPTWDDENLWTIL